MSRHHRKTRSEIALEQEEARQRAWSSFSPKLRALRCTAEVIALLEEMPPPDSPGRGFYTNLKWIFDTATVPFGADARELSYYISMVDGLSGQGHLPEEKTTRLISELKKRIKEIA